MEPEPSNPQALTRAGGYPGNQPDSEKVSEMCALSQFAAFLWISCLNTVPAASSLVWDPSSSIVTTLTMPHKGAGFPAGFGHTYN